jgi:2-phosphosulfolactate phosphatase
MTFADQSAFDVRCEWGLEGVGALAGCRSFIVVDVLSFSTCVSIAAERGVVVYPYPSRDLRAHDHAERHRAVLAGPRGAAYSLSPGSLLSADAGTRIVLPSPNGATISLRAAAQGRVFAGCLRNASAVGRRAMEIGGPIGIIPAGEQWAAGTLRPAVEDLLGAGAIVAALSGLSVRFSPEASAAAAAFRAAAPNLLETLLTSTSGRELVDRGFADDVRMAAQVDADDAVPELAEGAFVDSSVPRLARR